MHAAQRNLAIVRPKQEMLDPESLLFITGSRRAVMQPAAPQQERDTRTHKVFTPVFIHGHYLDPVAAGSAEKTDPACPSLP